MITAVGGATMSMDESALMLLFHRLNNQLGVIVVNAELLAAKAADDTHRARAAQLVAGALDAIATAREIRSVLPAPRSQEPSSIV